MAWWISLPIFQSFDEPAHFAQIQHIAMYGTYDTNSTISIEEYKLFQFLSFATNSRYTFNKNINAKGEKSFKKEYSSIHDQKTFKYSGTVEAYPPLYYFLAAGIYKIFSTRSIFFQIESIRFLSIIFFLITIFFSYKSSQIIFKKDRLAQYTTVIFIGFLPMLSQFTVSINPDNLIITLFSIFTYYGLKILNSKTLDIRSNIMAIIVILLGILTKQSAYLLIPVLLLLYVVQVHKFKINLKRDKRVYLIAPLLIIMIVLLLYLKGFNLIYSYITTTFQGLTVFSPFTYIANYYNNYLQNGYVFQSFWGTFGWGYFKFRQQYYDILFFLSTLSFVGIFIYLYNYIHYYKILHKKYKNLLNILYLIFIVSIYSIFLIYLDFISLKNTRDFFIQGHYFFPVITSISILLVYGLQQLIRKKYLLHIVYTSVIVLIVIFNITALFGILIHAFYL
ncbi:MAG: DUF2142 domain-containing protein [Patescibacteria group bacterium]